MGPSTNGQLGRPVLARLTRHTSEFGAPLSLNTGPTAIAPMLSISVHNDRYRHESSFDEACEIQDRKLQKKR